jgi:glycosyltransferase involved in cell wall biosynthesis
MIQLKVLHVTARADLGGGPRHLQYLIEILKRRIECYVACPEEPPFYDIFQRQVGIDNILTIPHRNFSIKKGNDLLRFVKAQKIDIIHCHGKGASVYGKYIKILHRRIRLVYTAHGLHFDNYNSMLNWVNLKYEKLTGWLFDEIIYVSSSEAEVAKKYKVFQSRKFAIIPNGVSLSYKEEREGNKSLKKELFPKSTDKPVILTISRYNYQKNMHECYQIAKSCREYNFLWLGIGDDLQVIKKQAERENVSNIIFYGATNDVSSFIGISDIYLSTARWEGMPLALLEAMSYGIPIVATDVTGNKDVVNSIVGCLYELGDINSAINSLNELLENPLDKLPIFQYFYENFSSEKMGKRTMDIYKHII